MPFKHQRLIFFLQQLMVQRLQSLTHRSSGFEIILASTRGNGVKET
jgi:hypothetical protein